jgi:L-threonylcarbamoyladenylate synthase
MILNGTDPAAVALAVDRLKSGGLIGLPTETVYGLAADACHAEAVGQVFKTKGRPADHPLIVHIAEIEMASHFASTVPEFALRLMQTFWPGPLTVILPRRTGVADAAAGQQATVGLRCPSHPVAQAVLQAAAAQGIWGLAAPSANAFGRVSPTTAAHVQGEFGDGLLILDGGACDVGIESTIVDGSRGSPVLLRPGRITRDHIDAVCTLAPQNSLPSPAPKASGTLASHYAPRARVTLKTEADIHRGLLALGVHAQNLAVWSHKPLPDTGANIVWRQQPRDARLAAHDLFATLRELDLRGVQHIWVESPPNTPDWEGVRDRLQRAAS